MDKSQNNSENITQASPKSEKTETQGAELSASDAVPVTPPVNDSIPQEAPAAVPEKTVEQPRVKEAAGDVPASETSAATPSESSSTSALEATQPTSGDPHEVSNQQAREVAEKIQETLEIIERKKVTGPLGSLPEAEEAQPAIPAPVEIDKAGKPAAPMSKDTNLRDTAVLSENSPMMRRAISHQGASGPGGTSNLGERREVILLVRGMVERLLIEPGLIFKLGRFDVSKKQINEVDLTPYGALDRGVSRIHAELHLEDDKLFITDLGSTNGTYLSGQRLNPNKPALLRKGDELLLGRLAIQVLFR